MTQAERELRARRIVEALGRFAPPGLRDRLASGWVGRLTYEQKVRKLTDEISARGLMRRDVERIARRMLDLVGITPQTCDPSPPPVPAPGLSRRRKILRVLYPHLAR